MNYNTLSLYLLAGGASIGLCTLLWALTRYKADALLLKPGAATILLLSVAFTVSGFGPELPRWMTAMGTNMAFLAAGVVIYPGLFAYCNQHHVATARTSPLPDWLGWGMVAATALPFWYWGLVEPDGHARAAVFSFAAAAINARTAHLLMHEAWRQRRNRALWGVGLLFGVVSFWMLARGGLYFFLEAPPPSQRGSNPTSWTTVAGLIGVLSALSLCIIWLEFKDPLKTHGEKPAAVRSSERISNADFVRNKLMLLWASVIVVVVGISTEAGLVFTQAISWEQQSQLQITTLANEANLNHTSQVFKQVDTVLHAVRSYYLRTQSAAETEHFINSLPFDKSVIDNIYLADAQANLLIAHDPQALGLSLKDRDYTRYHLASQSDQVHISGVEAGRVTGLDHFRVTRRISGSNGSFGGMVVATVNPQALSGYYSRQFKGPQNAAALLGVDDQKFRAVAPTLDAVLWQQRVSSPIWQGLAHAPAGSYRNTSVTDGLDRVFVYQKLDGLPLVMATGYAEGDLFESVYRRVRWGALAVCLMLAGMIGLAALLTIEIRRREEQNNFMAMLSHELKTPLSVIRMSMGNPGALSASTRDHVMRAVHDIDAIVYRCLQADRLNERGNPVVPQRCHIKELLADIHTASATPERLQFIVADLPPLQTDPQLVSIALNNLVDNALKYAPANAVAEVTVQPHTHHRQPGVLLCVSNPVGNAGMPDPQLVFKKYHRGQRAHHTTGSGLGLYLVHTVARLLGGFVRYAPTHNTVRFELWLPIAAG